MKPVNVFEERRPTGCTWWLVALFTIFVVLPVTCVKKVVHTARNTVASFDFEEDDIALVVLEEGNWAGTEATGCRGHLSPHPLAVVDRGRRALYAVKEGYQSPSPWVTPKYVWVRQYADGDVAYNAVYAVVRTPAQVKRWAQAHHYQGEFEFSLLGVVKNRSRGKPYATAHVPHYWKGQSQVHTTIYTDGGYAVFNGKIFERGPDEDAVYEVYRSIVQ